MNHKDICENPRKILLFSSILGVLGVILGAFGAHALKADLQARDMTGAWDTAVKYQLVHAVALLALAAWLEARLGSGQATSGQSQKLAAWAANFWFGGVILFSGSLYGLALGGPLWLGPVTPLGGLALITGWVLLAVAAWRG